MHLKVLEVRKDPIIVHDFDVPVLVASVGLPRPGRPPRIVPQEGSEQISQEHLDVEDEEPFEIDMDADWDLTTRQVSLHYIFVAMNSIKQFYKKKTLSQPQIGLDSMK